MKRKTVGFTLIEVTVAVAIMSVVMMTGPSILTSVTRFTRLSTARLETQRSAQNSLDRINRDLRQAVSNSIVITQETGQPYYSSIAFSTVDNRSLKYYQSGQNLYCVANGSTGTVAEGLTYVAFAYPRTDDPGIISVSLTFQKSTYQGGSKALQMAIENVRVMN